MTLLDAAFRRASPRFHPHPIPAAGAAIVAAIVAFWVAAFVAAFALGGLWAWSIGLAFLAYDLAQLGFVGIQAGKLFRAAPAGAAGAAPTVGVIVAAYNEAGALAATLDALLAQTSPPEEILLADDGSDDDSARVLASRYGLSAPASGAISEPRPHAPALRWLRLPHRGKAHALNAALPHIQSEVVVTVDADTFLAPHSLAAIRRAFAETPDLLVGGGVLEPRCRGGSLAGALQAFQRVEYVRNFLGRFAWSELDSLLLISGAFAAFRTSAVRDVGGFDPCRWSRTTN